MRSRPLLKFSPIFCDSTHRTSTSRSSLGDPDLKFLEASVLVSVDAAIEKLLKPLGEGENEECLDQFGFVTAAVEKLGYEVKTVKITSRVMNTYYASLYLDKPGDNGTVCIDSRPSDAYRIGYGGRAQSIKPIFNVILDSAPEGPDPLSEELKLVRNMDLACKKKRYNDAAIWRDRLKKLQKSRLVDNPGLQMKSPLRM